MKTCSMEGAGPWQGLHDGACMMVLDNALAMQGRQQFGPCAQLAPVSGTHTAEIGQWHAAILGHSGCMGAAGAAVGQAKPSQALVLSEGDSCDSELAHACNTFNPHHTAQQPQHDEHSVWACIIWAGHDVYKDGVRAKAAVHHCRKACMPKARTLAAAVPMQAG